MPTSSDVLIVQCQLALGLTQKELGHLLGRDRRTIQRWQKNGFAPMPEEAHALADALRASRPDLADEVLELGKNTAIAAGIALPNSPASVEVIDAILQAAADAGGTSPEAIRPAVTAAFDRAAAAGVEVTAVVTALTRGSA
jgi:transcriptional regulator with XRE-family HTH domain